MNPKSQLGDSEGLATKRIREIHEKEAMERWVKTGCNGMSLDNWKAYCHDLDAAWIEAIIKYLDEQRKA